jgi:hypothetical protein
MNYCTIQEAWGKENYISNQLNISQCNIEKKPIEKFENNLPVHKPIIKEKFSNNNKIKNNNNHKNNHINNLNCDNFVNHLKTCRSCQNKMRNQFRPKILENFEDMIQTNRDIIVLILIGLCIMIFLNMVYNFNSDNK